VRSRDHDGPQNAATSIPLLPHPTYAHVFFSTLYSTTRRLCSSPTVTDQVSYPHKTTRKIVVRYILIFIHVNSKRKDKTLPN